MYLAETYCLQKNIQTLLVATEKNGHEVNTENTERMFILCEKNVEECHNVKLSNIFFCVVITKKKPKPHSQINRGHFKLEGKCSIFFSA